MKFYITKRYNLLDYDPSKHFQEFDENKCKTSFKSILKDIDKNIIIKLQTRDTKNHFKTLISEYRKII